MSFEIGDKVYCTINNVYGTVTAINNGKNYPISARFNDGRTREYTKEGKLLLAHFSTALELIKTATTIEPQKNYKVSQIDKLGHVVELDDGTKFYQSHSGSILPLNSIKF